MVLSTNCGEGVREGHKCTPSKGVLRWARHICPKAFVQVGPLDLVRIYEFLFFYAELQTFKQPSKCRGWTTFSEGLTSMPGSIARLWGPTHVPHIVHLLGKRLQRVFSAWVIVNAHRGIGHIVFFLLRGRKMWPSGTGTMTLVTVGQT